MAIPAENSKPVIGAAPEGAADREQAAAKVREMFTAIAPRYDVLNHVLSMQVDRFWWWRAARAFRHILQRDRVTVMDLCCGTGDMTAALLSRAQKSGAAPKIVGADFSHAMLQRATTKLLDKPLRWMEADALNLPVPNETLDLVTSAFGFRNLADYDAGLREIYRVLKPGGEIGILDFGEPKGIVGWLYRLYFRYVLPAIGTLVSGIKGPYKYLPASVARFPAPEQMRQRMRAAGFQQVSWTPYTFGVAGLYRGKKN
jgi:demethylmenaquinone methyltransferase/2-methoxy-6-polyprenyl-1,4-benzoquinol methylase